MKKFLLIALAFIATSPLLAQNFTAEGIKYNILTATTVEVIAKSPAYSGSITIPPSVTYNSTSYAVSSIGNNAFYSCTGLTSVMIPNVVTSISSNAFYGCTGLTSITIPNAVTSIGESAFHGCSGLTSVTIPNAVTSIGLSAFRSCIALTTVTISNSVTSISNYTFSNCAALTSVTIPNSVTSIGNNAFAGCAALTSVTIPNSVTSIGNTTFDSCTGLTSITIPNAVTVIGAFAFYGCSGLTSVTLSNSLTSIGNATFAFCSGLTSVTIPNSVTSIGSQAYYGCTGLTSVTVNWTTPLAINETVFQGVTLSNVTLNVPAGTVATYQAAPVWGGFSPINATLANESFENTANINLYPNPSNGIFNFQLANDLQIEVYNSLGQLLSSEKMTSGNNTINITNQAAGIYFLKANDDGATTSTYKIIKN